MNTRIISSAFMLALLLSLSACGGGSGGSGDGDGDGDGTNSPAPDVKPDAFTFKDVNDAEPGAFYTASMTVSGVDAAVKARACCAGSDPEISLDGGATWGREAMDVNNGDEVMIRLKSSAEPGGAVEGQLFVGGTVVALDAEGTVKNGFRVVTRADTANPELAIHFPPAAGYTDATSIRVRGVVKDDFRVAKLTVNGEEVSPDPVTGEWQHVVPLSAGANVIEVVATDAAVKASGRTLTIDTTSTTVGSGELMGTSSAYQGLDVSRDGTRVFYGGANGMVYQLDLETGKRTVLSREPDIGTGPAVTFIRGITVGSNGELYIANHGQVVSVDASNGDRTSLSNDTGTGAGPSFNAMQVVSDPVSGRLYVASDRTPDNVTAVVLSSGDRTVISDATTGTGPEIDSPGAITIDATGAVYVNSDDGSGDIILKVDPATGDRIDVSAGSGPEIGGAADIRFWQEEGRVLSLVESAVLAVDLETGDRTELSGETTGEGPAFEGAAMGFHSPSRVAFVVDNDLAGDRVFAVDLENGDRIVIAAD